MEKLIVDVLFHFHESIRWLEFVPNSEDFDFVVIFIRCISF